MEYFFILATVVYVWTCMGPASVRGMRFHYLASFVSSHFLSIVVSRVSRQLIVRGVMLWRPSFQLLLPMS